MYGIQQIQIQTVAAFSVYAVRIAKMVHSATLECKKLQNTVRLQRASQDGAKSNAHIQNVTASVQTQSKVQMREIFSDLSHSRLPLTTHAHTQTCLAPLLYRTF